LAHRILADRKQQIKERLAEIDTPEYAQSYGTRAKQELSRLIYRKTVIVKVQDTDRYGRKVGRVYKDDVDVNAEMIRLGAAWVYRNMPEINVSILLRNRPDKIKKDCGVYQKLNEYHLGNGEKQSDKVES
jgi:endonuclease YncB( thermonuclease family)